MISRSSQRQWNMIKSCFSKKKVGEERRERLGRKDSLRRTARAQATAWLRISSSMSTAFKTIFGFCATAPSLPISPHLLSSAIACLRRCPEKLRCPRNSQQYNQRAAASMPEPFYRINEFKITFFYSYFLKYS